MAKRDWSLDDVRRQMREASPPAPNFEVASVGVADDALRLRLASGVGIDIPITLIPEVQGNSSELQEVRIFGDAVEWPALDVHLNLAGLVVDALGVETVRREIAKRNGARSSAAKAAAVRENGKKGGRPRKAAGDR